MLHGYTLYLYVNEFIVGLKYDHGGLFKFLICLKLIAGICLFILAEHIKY
jgi:hypothetical protein